LDGERQVNQSENKAAILHQETQTDPFLLEVNCDVAEVWLPIFNERVMIWTLSQQKYSGCL
jgi:hypothetical protein